MLSKFWDAFLQMSIYDEGPCFLFLFFRAKHAGNLNWCSSVVVLIRLSIVLSRSRAITAAWYHIKEPRLAVTLIYLLNQHCQISTLASPVTVFTTYCLAFCFDLCLWTLLIALCTVILYASCFCQYLGSAKKVAKHFVLLVDKLSTVLQNVKI